MHVQHDVLTLRRCLRVSRYEGDAMTDLRMEHCDAIDSPAEQNASQQATMFIEWCALSGLGVNGWPKGAYEQLVGHLLDAHSDGYRAGLNAAASEHENINPASDDERLNGSPGAGAMGAVIEYRDKIRKLATP